MAYLQSKKFKTDILGLRVLAQADFELLGDPGYESASEGMMVAVDSSTNSGSETRSTARRIMVYSQGNWSELAIVVDGVLTITAPEGQTAALVLESDGPLEPDDANDSWKIAGKDFARVTATVNSGAVNGFTVNHGGSNYTSATVLITPHANDVSATGAVGTATISNGSVASIAVTSGGSGYNNVPTITILDAGNNDATSQEGKLVFSNDTASKGVFVEMASITANNAPSNSTAAFAGHVTVGHDLHLEADSSILKIGAGSDVTITHDGGTGATLASAGAFVVDGANTVTVDSDSTLTLGASSIDIDADGGDGAGAINIDTNDTTNGVRIGANTSGMPIRLGHGTSEVTVGDNLTVTGDLTVNGATTTLQTDTVVVEDPLIVLGLGNTGTNKDLGVVMVRNGDNMGLIFDESDDYIKAANIASEDGTTSGHISSVTPTDFMAGKVAIDSENDHIDVTGGHLTATAAQNFIIDAAGDIELNADNGAVLFKDDGESMMTLNDSGLSFDDNTDITMSTNEGSHTSLRMIASNSNASYQSNIVLDADGFVELNADGGTIDFKDGSASMMQLTNTGLTFDDATTIEVTTGDLDIKATDTNANIAFTVDDNDTDVQLMRLLGVSRQVEIVTDTSATNGGLRVKTSNTDGYSQVAARGQISLYRFSDSATDFSQINFVKRDTTSNFGPHTDDIIGKLRFSGRDTSSTYEEAASIRVAADADHADSSTDVPGRIEFYTTPDGSETPAQRMVIKNDGKVGIGESTPTHTLDVNGDVNVGSNSYMVLSDNQIGITSGDLTLDVNGNVEINADGGTVSIKDDTESLVTITNSGLSFNDATEIDVSTGDLTLDVAGEIELNADGGKIKFKDDTATLAELSAGELSFPGAATIEVDVNTATDHQDLTIKATNVHPAMSSDIVLDAEGEIRINSDAGTILFQDDTASLMSLTNDGLSFDDATEIDVSSGNLTLDVAGDIELNADNGTINFMDDSASLMQLTNTGLTFDDATTIETTSGNLNIKATGNDADIIFTVNDNGTPVTAFKLDGGIYGSALFTPANGGYLSVDDADTDGKVNIEGRGDINLYRYSDTSTVASQIEFHRTRGDSGSQTNVQDNDILGSLVFSGKHHTTGPSAAAIIRAEVDGEVATGSDTSDIPGRIVFSTTPDGSSSFQDRMVIKNDGKVGIGVTDPDSPLEIFASSNQLKLSNNADDYTVFNVDSNGGLNIDTHDAAGASADITLDADGDVKLEPAGQFFVNAQSSSSIIINGGGNTFTIDTNGNLNLNSATRVNVGTNMSGVPVSIGHATSEVTVNDNLIVSGDLTVNGTTTTINSTTLSVDDKNIELGLIENITGVQASAALSTSNAEVEVPDVDGVKILVGATLTKTAGAGAFNAGGATVQSKSSSGGTTTLVIAEGNNASSGAIEFTVDNTTDVAADGGGITLKGTTDKEFKWVNATGRWTTNVGMHLDTNDTLVLPVGTTAQRPSSPANGMIRFNTTIGNFEGYSNSAWAPIGGVQDIDGNTYITAETSPNANNNDLDFYTNGYQRLQIDQDGRVHHGRTDGNYNLNTFGPAKVWAKSQSILADTAWGASNSWTSTGGGFVVAGGKITYSHAAGTQTVGTNAYVNRPLKPNTQYELSLTIANVSGTAHLRVTNIAAADPFATELIEGPLTNGSKNITLTSRGSTASNAQFILEAFNSSGGDTFEITAMALREKYDTSTQNSLVIDGNVLVDGLKIDSSGAYTSIDEDLSSVSSNHDSLASAKSIKDFVDARKLANLADSNTPATLTSSHLDKSVTVVENGGTKAKIEFSVAQAAAISGDLEWDVDGVYYKITYATANDSPLQFSGGGGTSATDRKVCTLDGQANFAKAQSLRGIMDGEFTSGWFVSALVGHGFYVESSDKSAAKTWNITKNTINPATDFPIVNTAGVDPTYEYELATKLNGTAPLVALGGLTMNGDKIPYFNSSTTASLLNFSNLALSNGATTVPSANSVKSYIDTNKGASNLPELNDVNSSITANTANKDKVLGVKEGAAPVTSACTWTFTNGNDFTGEINFTIDNGTGSGNPFQIHLRNGNSGSPHFSSNNPHRVFIDLRDGGDFGKSLTTVLSEIETAMKDTGNSGTQYGPVSKGYLFSKTSNSFTITAPSAGTAKNIINTTLTGGTTAISGTSPTINSVAGNDGSYEFDLLNQPAITTQQNDIINTNLTGAHAIPKSSSYHDVLVVNTADPQSNQVQIDHPENYAQNARVTVMNASENDLVIGKVSSPSTGFDFNCPQLFSSPQSTIALVAHQKALLIKSGNGGNNVWDVIVSEL